MVTFKNNFTQEHIRAEKHNAAKLNSTTTTHQQSEHGNTGRCMCLCSRFHGKLALSSSPSTQSLVDQAGYLKDSSQLTTYTT